MARQPVPKKCTTLLVSFYIALVLAFTTKCTTSSRLLNQQLPATPLAATTVTNVATVPPSSNPVPKLSGTTVPSTIEPAAQTPKVPLKPLAASLQPSVPLPANSPSLNTVAGTEQPLTFFMHGIVPYVAGIVGTSLTNFPDNANAAENDLPLDDAENLLSGMMTVIDDELTDGQGTESSVIGRAQGFTAASSKDGTSQTLALTAMLDGGAEDSTNDALSFFGVYSTTAQECRVSIIGGTGKYEGAKGFAEIQTLQPGDDGVEPLLKFMVHLY